MPLNRNLKLLFTFSRRFLTPSFFFTALFLYALHKWGAAHTKGLLFLLKFMTSCTIAYLVLQYRKHEFYFYKNFGLSPLKILITGLIIDYLLFTILIV